MDRSDRSIDLGELGEILTEARNRGLERVKALANTLRQKYSEIVQAIDENVVLSPEVRKSMLMADQKALRKRVLSENLQTRKGIIKLNNRIRENTSLLEQLKIMRSLEQDPFQQVLIDGRIGVADERITKMMVARTSLEGILEGLNKLASQLEDVIFLEALTPIAANLDDLFEKIDRAQEESDRLAGLPVDDRDIDDEAIRELEELEDTEIE
jgi:hypothetical protein